MSMRTDSDSWDLATSVGAAATMVAAQRALASAAGLIDDPFAAPLVHAVGIDVYTRLVNGEIPVTGDTEFDPDRMARGMAIRTRFYDQHFVDATRNGIRQAVILAAGWMRVPTGCPGRKAPSSTRSTCGTSSISKPRR